MEQQETSSENFGINPSQPISNYVLIGGALVIGVLTVFGIEYMRPALDNLALEVATFTFIGSVLTYFKAEQTHVSVNSQLSEWKAEVVGQARAQGNIEGRDAEKADPVKTKLEIQTIDSNTVRIAALEKKQ